ncbi:MAG: anhydro-N-acetylmuramic acid kinase [Acidobacteriia bacterium]|nr:anhydro-N-acetylmuramic acid kinase [Terriglobia bacterium]
MKASHKKGVLALGIMSGTSADGIDVALVRISGRGAKLQNFAAIPFSARVREAILRLGEGRAVTTGEISQLNFLLGKTFGEAALAALRKFRVSPARIEVIGSHGQTIFHQGIPARFCGERIASTLQIGEPSVIAGLTGITTVGDFRPADMAAGGQGAPLVPFVDLLMYRSGRVGRAALNIGGIANITAIPAGAEIGDVFAFDTGPGNMVMDALVRRFTGGRKTFDRDAEMARHGTLLPGLLDHLLRDPFLRKTPPKTAGREQYGEKFVRALLGRREARGAKAEDLVRTATIFTALSILDAVHRFVSPRARISELIVSGGGARNPLLMAQLESGLQGVRLRDSGEFGVPGDAKEAFAFAVLGYQTLHRRPANVPGATGAKAAVVLGKVCYAG